MVTKVLFEFGSPTLHAPPSAGAILLLGKQVLLMPCVWWGWNITWNGPKWRRTVDWPFKDSRQYFCRLETPDPRQVPGSVPDGTAWYFMAAFHQQHKQFLIEKTGIYIIAIAIRVCARDLRYNHGSQLKTRFAWYRTLSIIPLYDWWVDMGIGEISAVMYIYVYNIIVYNYILYGMLQRERETL